MNITKIELACIGIFILLCVISVYFYPQMPQILATQWDFHGNVSGTMPKTMELFLAPTILAALILTLIIIPRVASVSSNLERFKKVFGGAVITFSIIILAAQYHVILWNIGTKNSPNWVIGFICIVIVTFFFWRYRIRRQNNSN
jgi:uncharacterized membrane protein